MESNVNIHAMTHYLESEYGGVSPDYIGRTQSEMSEVLKSFLNDFIERCRKNGITRFSLPMANIEYIDGRTDRSHRYPLHGREFQFLLEDVLHSRSDVIQAKLTITGRIATNFLFDIKCRNGENIHEEVGCILVPPNNGKMRFIIEFRGN